MKKLIIIFTWSLLLSSAEGSVNCLKLPAKNYIGMEATNDKNISHERIGKHELIYLKDSCSSHGCEYFIFSEAFPGCKVQSFHQTGFLLPGSYKGKRLKIRQKQIIKTFLYSLQDKKFVVLP